MEIESQSLPEQHARTAWFVYQVLVWVCGPLVAIGLVLKLSYGQLVYFEIFKHLPWVEYVLKGLFVFSCARAMLRMPWGPHLVRVTSLWYAVLIWATIPGLVNEAISTLLYGPPVWVGGPSDFVQGSRPTYVFLLRRLVGLFVLLALIITAHAVSKSRKPGEASIMRRLELGARRWHLLWFGLCCIFLGLTLNWLDSYVPENTYPKLVGSYLIFAGVVLALASHLFDRDSFLACSPVSASGVLLLYGPVLWSWAATLVLWFAPVALALVNLFRSKPGLKLKVAVLAFPMLVFLFGYLPSGPVSTPGITAICQILQGRAKETCGFSRLFASSSVGTRSTLQGRDQPLLALRREGPLSRHQDPRVHKRETGAGGMETAPLRPSEPFFSFLPAGRVARRCKRGKRHKIFELERLLDE